MYWFWLVVRLVAMFLVLIKFDWFWDKKISILDFLERNEVEILLILTSLGDVSANFLNCEVLLKDKYVHEQFNIVNALSVPGLFMC